MTTVYDGYYLLDHHRNRNNPSGPASDPDTRPWYTNRRATVTAIVIHTPETLEDFVAPYSEAERIAAYGATITRASWHDTIDADSIIPMLPPEFTAWHVRGYNSETIGMEIGATATSWNRAPAAWVTGVMENAAERAAQHADQFGIPIRFITRAQLDAGERGFTSHAQLDPERRSDPGADFPWDRFLNLVKGVDMIDRKTSVDPNPVLAEDFDQLLKDGVFTEWTDPGGIVFKDELAAFMLRERNKVTKKLIAAAVSGIAGGATVSQVIDEIVRRLGG